MNESENTALISQEINSIEKTQIAPSTLSQPLHSMSECHLLQQTKSDSENFSLNITNRNTFTLNPSNIDLNSKQTIEKSLNEKIGMSCKFCGFLFQYSDDLDKHLSENINERLFECSFDGCKQLFQSVCKLRQHQQMFAHSEFSLLDHTLYNNNNNQYTYTSYRNTLQCKICSKILPNVQQLKVHLSTHNTSKPYQCRFCDARFSRKDKVLIHEIRGTGHNYACKLCPKRYMFPTQLTLHHSKIHRGITNAERDSSPPPPPPPLPFISKGTLNEDKEKKIFVNESLSKMTPFSHNATQLNTNNSFNLNNASSTFTSNSSSFLSPSVLLSQSDSGFTNQNNDFSQNIPNSGYFIQTENNLASKRFSYNISNSLQFKNTFENQIIQPTLRYPCKYCDKRFVNESELARHIRKHTGEKPYGCLVCGKKFAQNGNLLRHKTTHTGQRPHKCHICLQTFTDPSSLTRHKRIHTDFKPYVCDECNLHFRNISNLKAHRVVRHGLPTPHQCKICHVYKVTPSQLSKHMKSHKVGNDENKSNYK